MTCRAMTCPRWTRLHRTWVGASSVSEHGFATWRDSVGTLQGATTHPSRHPLSAPWPRRSPRTARWVHASCAHASAGSVPELLETERVAGVDGDEITVQHALLRLPPPLADVHYVRGGDADAPAVLLLHGFPDSYKTWRFQMPALVRAGYRVIAPDLRGYGRSGKPEGVAAYGPAPVTDDLAALLEAECSGGGGGGGDDGSRGKAKVHAVVGHDWGAAVAYAFAARHRDALKRLVILNGVHPSIFLKFVLSNPLQLLKSYYIGFFQLPVIPEVVIAAADFAILRAIFRFDPADPLPRADVEDVIDACRQEGALEVGTRGASLSLFASFI